MAKLRTINGGVIADLPGGGPMCDIHIARDEKTGLSLGYGCCTWCDCEHITELEEAV